MLESIENELHGLEIRVNLAYRTRSMRVERLAGLLQNLVQVRALIFRLLRYQYFSKQLQHAECLTYGALWLPATDTFNRRDCS